MYPIPNLHRTIPAHVDDKGCQLCKLPKTEQPMLLHSKTRLVESSFQETLVKPSRFQLLFNILYYTFQVSQIQKERLKPSA
ncbi:hypothetical protein RO3G_03138 [Rhizopus delemar RA 99-880]|uniref:Uncharacterized protein n=1 Tax=Rhizopus delemar (strain RA 99-880 / ATCC MYA-4621 / FGSC 9543 / NRRL 43880) TaxID=246409 RepID=I1BQF4_RHIO9|nr:hypothetical protein RO3G_03138 [Rhizopus delemar RA 99-880]|eukprot:EIE78434.1 hypothetical protein RO3G_03138 [Rhizopus delemar RA 99-880]